MKIEISKESLDFVRKLVTEIAEQDNRITADPYFFVIQEEQIKVVPDGCGDFVRWAHSEGGLLDEREVREFLEDTERPIDDLAESCDELTRYDCVKEWVTPENHNVFFTEAAIEKHISENDYHWRGKTRTYVRHAWRNPEMAAIMKALREVAGRN